MTAIQFEVVQRDGRYSARADGGPSYAVGRRVRWTDPATGVARVGLLNAGGERGLSYRAEAFVEAFGDWARIIAPTAACEGGGFDTLNTYDRAGFTFGFAQFAAHVPDGDFIRWLRAMLGREEADAWLPDLEVRGGRIAVRTGPVLEDAGSTERLRAYLNPGTQVEAAESLAAARLIGWTRAEPGTRRLQVRCAVEAARRILREADLRLRLDGRAAALCCAVFDIRHQGRATYARMREALEASDPLDALLTIGATRYPSRARTLRAELVMQAAALDGLSWNTAAGEFVRSQTAGSPAVSRMRALKSLAPKQRSLKVRAAEV